VGTAGLLITAYALSAGVFGLVAAPWLDRLGRRPVILTCMALLAAATLASAFAPTFAILLGFRLLAGLAVAAIQPSALAAVGDYVPYEQRGRAMGALNTANLMAGILGVPAGAVLADLTSWRITFVVIAGLTALGALVFLALFPRSEKPAAPATPVSYRADFAQVFRSAAARISLASNTVMTFGAMGWQIFMAAFFIHQFGLTTSTVGFLSAIGSGGVLVGTNLGGRIADRSGKMPVIIVAGLLAPLFLLLEVTLIIDAWFAGAMHFIYAGFIGARVSSAMALMTALIPEKRGALMAINAAGGQLGIMAGSALGGVVIALAGYSVMGVGASVIVLLSAVMIFRLNERAIVGAYRPAGA
jgi:predicted MFS family arabinose efflux permease